MGATDKAMPNPIASLTTARLLAEAICPSHLPDLHRLLSDPQVMKTLSADGKPLSEEATREQIGQNIDHWQQHGFGLWVFHCKSDGVFIGRGGLKTCQIDGKGVIGLAYAVMPDYWNQGFATATALRTEYNEIMATRTPKPLTPSERRARHRRAVK